MKQENDILLQAIQTKGVPNQLGQAVEEFGELITAINKIQRAGIVDEYIIHKPNKDHTFGQITAYNNLCSEIADAEIMIRQLRMMLCSERIDISIDRKIQRIAKRITNKTL